MQIYIKLVGPLPLLIDMGDDLNEMDSNSYLKLMDCKFIVNESSVFSKNSDLLRKIELCERLHYFGDKGEFNRTFLNELQWLRDVWIDKESEELFNSRIVAEIEDKLERIPFKDAVSYKTPVDEHLANMCLDEFSEWRTNVCVVMAMQSDEQIKIYERFEYMCHFVINAREELMFDIQSQINE